MPDVLKKYGAKPFQEAVDFFAQKVNLPTERWDDLWQGQHARGFMVAGAMKSDLLIDLRGAVEKAITDGETLADFRGRFDEIIEKTGWVYKGGRNWRTKVIYDTNVRQAYNTGRYQQMADPDVTALRPYLQYRHGDSKNPRPEHLAWDGLVLRHDDPFWDTHKPQNGWGCRCFVVTLSQRDLTKIGKTGPDASPKVDYYDYKNPQTGAVEKMPVGIDPGFDYDPGKAHQGKWLSDQEKAYWEGRKRDAWELLTPGDYRSYGRPENVPIDQAVAAIDHTAEATTAGVKEQIIRAIGEERRTFDFTRGDFKWEVLIDADFLAGHIDAARAKYMPLLLETLNDPYEIWSTFERHKGSGKVVLRQRMIKGVVAGKKQGMLVVADASDGVMKGWTVFTEPNQSKLNKHRKGKLCWKRDKN